MKAIVKYKKGKGFVELRDVPEPVIKDDEALIEVKAVSICGSDIHIFHDEHPYWPPVIMGHELSGVVAEAGKDVFDWKPGDRMVSETRTKSCGVCFFCRTANPQVCPDKRPLGIGVDGAMAKYIAIPAKLLHHLPESISFEDASVTEPIAVCVHGLIERTKINAGDIVLISGAGPIGLICLSIAKAAGAYVIISGTSRSAELKLTKAKELGADEIINIDKVDIKKRILELTGGLGADLVIDASGAGSAIKSAFELVRRQGKICALGITGKPTVEVPWDTAIFKAPIVTFCFSSSWSSWETGIKLIQRKLIQPGKLITHKFPLEKWKEAFDIIQAGKAIKVVLIPNKNIDDL